jgi:serpin B
MISIPVSINPNTVTNYSSNYIGVFQDHKLTATEYKKYICSQCDNEEQNFVYDSKLCMQCDFKKVIAQEKKLPLRKKSRKFSKVDLYSSMLNEESSIQKYRDIPLAAKDTNPRTTFYFELLILLQESKNSNVITSPTSIRDTLMLVSLGASGTTKQKLINLFDEVGMISSEKLSANLDTIEANDSLLANYLAQTKEENSQNNSWITSIINKIWSTTDETSRLDNFNAVLTTNRLPLSKHMKKRLSALKAVAGDKVLSSNNFIKDINEVFAIKTNGDVQEIVKKEDFTGAEIAILNAINFHGKWKSAFTRDKHKMPFSLLTGKSIPVKSMSLKTTDYKMASLENWQAVRLFYKGDKYAMDIILPPEKVTTENNFRKASAIISRLTYLLNSKQHTSRQKEINIKMPLFSFSSEINLLGIMEKHPKLKSLGLSKLNLDEMVQGGYVGAITKVLQKCYIDVNEVDTTARAVTNTRIAKSISYAKQFCVNRPFYFSLANTENNDIVMAGFVQEPSTNR